MLMKRIATAIRACDWIAIEFVIVVLGIFVALQVGDWNQGRMDRQLEQVYITRLIDETRANRDILDQHERIFEDKVDFIFALPDLSLDEAIRPDPQAFMQRLENSSYMSIPDMRSETQELESAGRLSLLCDTHRRDAIANNLDDCRSTRNVLAEPIGDYRRILFETLPGKSFHDYRAGVDATDPAPIIAAMEALGSDPRFEGAANAEITYGSDTLFWIRPFTRRTQEILALLETGQSPQ